MDATNAVILRAAPGEPDDDVIIGTAACARCREDVPVTRKMKREMDKHGGVVAHAVCPVDAARAEAVMRTFSIEVRIGADLDDDPHEAPTDDRVETLGWFRATAQGEHLRDALPELSQELSERWDRQLQNVDLMDPQTLKPVSTD